MGATNINSYFHIVFSVKNRARLIEPEMQQELYRVISHIVRQEQGVLCAIGGVSDHVHLLVGWHSKETLANLMRNVKAKSSGWVHRHFPEKTDFCWQRGYSAFSIGEAAKENVVTYIQNQETHHQQQSFSDELKMLLAENGLAHAPHLRED